MKVKVKVTWISLQDHHYTCCYLKELCSAVSDFLCEVDAQERMCGWAKFPLSEFLQLCPNNDLFSYIS
jgi:hypothetical protein